MRKIRFENGELVIAQSLNETKSAMETVLILSNNYFSY